MPFNKPFIAGNWKMHKTPDETRAFMRAFLSGCPHSDARTVAIFPPALCLDAARTARADRRDIHLGVQNIHWESHGAFTGEISAPMAGAAGAAFVLCGHSERRHVFGETPEETGRKAAAAIAAGLTPVVCVGEKLEEREAGRLEEVVLSQLDAALATLTDQHVAAIVLAYEPVWAIGTGRTATPADAAHAHALLRASLGRRIGAEGASLVPILYGGSVKPDNAAALLAADQVDGLLVGGASLEPDSFARIVAAGG